MRILARIILCLIYLVVSPVAFVIIFGIASWQLALNVVGQLDGMAK